MGATAAIVSAVVGVGGAIKQREAQKDAQKDQEKAQRQQAAMNAAQAARERRQQVREERIRRAQVIQASSTSGVAGSSGQLGATSSLGTQLGTNLGFNAGMLQGANRISSLQQSAANSMGSAQTWGQISQLGMAGFQMAGGFNALSDFKVGGWVPTQQGAPVEDRSIFR